LSTVSGLTQPEPVYSSGAADALPEDGFSSEEPLYEAKDYWSIITSTQYHGCMRDGIGDRVAVF
jgi:hypothetical protein